MTDPKEDPQPGDRLRKGKRVRVVTQRDRGDVWYVIETSTSTPRTVHVCWITTWQDWAKDAEVQP